VREAISDEYIELTYCPTEQMVADVLTNLSPVINLEPFNWRWDLCQFKWECYGGKLTFSLIG